MKVLRNAAVLFLLVMCSAVISGCGKKADESKPMDEVRAEAEKMDAGQLREMAMAYKNVIVAKMSDIEKVTKKLEEIPVADMMGTEAKGLKSDIKRLQNSVSALKIRFNVYYDKLKEAKGDLSGLEI